MSVSTIIPDRMQYPRIVRPLVPLLGRDPVGSNRFPYFVNPKAPSASTIGGDDGRDGLSVESAFRTMQKAIDTCKANVGDRIIRLRGTETVTETINFNKAGIVVQASDLGISPAAVAGAAAGQPELYRGMGVERGHHQGEQVQRQPGCTGALPPASDLSE